MSDMEKVENILKFEDTMEPVLRSSQIPEVLELPSTNSGILSSTDSPMNNSNKCWQGTNEHSWAKTIPDRPQVFDWRNKNEMMFRDVTRAHDASYLTEYNVKRSLIQTGMDGDKNQKITQTHLSHRCMNLHTNMKLLEEAIDKLDQDVYVLQTRKQRLRAALQGLRLVGKINQECLHIRSLRMENDNLSDQPYEELIKENNLVNDIDKLMLNTLAQIHEQIQANMQIKCKLQLEWSDKKQAYDIDVHNLSLHIKSDEILFRASSARVPEDQSTPISWENYTRANLNEAVSILAKSADLISYLDGPILSQYVKDLRVQADRVNQKLADKVCALDKQRGELEHELQMVINHLGETETVIGELKNLIQNLEKALKVAQTRLDNRLSRQGIENCRDEVQAGLLEEVKCLTSQISTSLMQLQQAETTQNGLLFSRNKLEYEVQVKRKSISVDQERCVRIRQHYPALTTLSGH